MVQFKLSKDLYNLKPDSLQPSGSLLDELCCQPCSFFFYKTMSALSSFIVLKINLYEIYFRRVVYYDNCLTHQALN